MHGATSVARAPRAPGEDTSNAPKSCAALQNPSHRSRIKHRYEPNKPMHHEISPPDALRSVHPPSPRAHTHKSVRRQRLLSPQSAASCSLAHGSAWTAPTASAPPWCRPTGRVPPRPLCLAGLIHRRTQEPLDPTSPGSVQPVPRGSAAQPRPRSIKAEAAAP